MCSCCEAGERTTKDETCANQMTDSFQAHKDDPCDLSQARAVRSALVNKLYCAVCAVFVAVLSIHTPSIFWNSFQETKITTICQMM